MAPLFQAREIPRIVPSLPPIKRLAADTEVATGQRRILSMPPAMVQPLQSCFCQPADPLGPAYDFGTRSSRTYYLHDDTILSVTYHYEREHEGGACGLSSSSHHKLRDRLQTKRQAGRRGGRVRVHVLDSDSVPNYTRAAQGRPLPNLAPVRVLPE